MRDHLMADEELLDLDLFYGIDSEAYVTDLFDDGFDDRDDGFDDLDEMDDEDVVDFVDVDVSGLEESLYEALSDEYVDVQPEELAEAMSNVFGSLTPAESFNVAKALGQIGKGAAQALDDPALRQIAVAALPIAGGAVGTAVGGPVGTAVGTSLGAAAGTALSPTPTSAAPKPSKPAAPATASPPPANVPKPAASAGAAAQGSAAAAKALACSQQPDVLKALLALALGEHGRSSVNGIPVGAVMNMLSTIYSRAAADADELSYARERVPSYLFDADGFLSADPISPSERADALYDALLDGENHQLAETVGLG